MVADSRAKNNGWPVSIPKVVPAFLQIEDHSIFSLFKSKSLKLEYKNDQL